MVYFENKTRNHAKGFRIQKHLLPANESCVLVLQNCCATDFRKTVIRFVASQVPAAFLHANSECPGAWPLSSRSRGAPPTEHADAPHPPQNIAALEPKPRRRATDQRIQQSILRTACPPTRADYPRNALTTSQNMYFLDTISPNGKGAFQRPKSWRES